MKPKITLGSLISGTVRPIDTIPAMINEAIRRSHHDTTEPHYMRFSGPWKILEATNEQWPVDNEGRSLANGKDGSTMTRALDFVEIGQPYKGVKPNEYAPWWTEDLDNGQGWTNHEENQQVWQELVDLLNEDLAGATFGTHPDDPADLGYWAEPNEDDSGEGLQYAWRRTHPGLELYIIDGKDRETVFLQTGDDMHWFQSEIGAVDFIWMNDPKNEEGRVFKTIEEHYDAIMDPYFGND